MKVLNHLKSFRIGLKTTGNGDIQNINALGLKLIIN